MSAGSGFITQDDRAFQRRVLKEFIQFAPLMTGLIVITCALGLGLSFTHQLYVAVMFFSGLIAYAGWRYRHIKKYQLENLSPTAISEIIQSLSRYMVGMSALSALLLFTLMDYGTRSSLIMIGAWTCLYGTLMTLIVYTQGNYAKIVWGLSFAPPILFLLQTEQKANFYLAGIITLAAGISLLLVRTLRRIVNTHYEKMEQYRHESRMMETRFQNFAALSQKYYFTCDANGNIDHISNEVADLLSLPQEQPHHLALRDIFGEIDRYSEDHFDILKSSMGAGIPFTDIEICVLRADQLPLYLAVTGMPVTDHTASITCYDIWMKDISEYRYQHLQLIYTTDRLNDFSYLTSETLWETDKDYVFLQNNADTENMIDFCFKEKLGNLHSLTNIHWEEKEFKEARRRLWSTLKARRPFHQFLLPGQNNRVFTISGIPLYDAEDRFDGYRGSIKDITDEYDAK
ncbi:MAG: PAS domain-containing protein, partial [Pseudomonadota bacterium]